MTRPGTLRPLNPLRDLMAVADLIELCFHGTIDAEGRSYIYDLRRSSRLSGLSALPSKGSPVPAGPGGQAKAANAPTGRWLRAGLAEWAARTSDLAGMPLSGFVWEDSGQIVGNVSLIPFNRRGNRVTLIANVAVHPDYRRRGIARHLTQRALLAARERSVQDIWLQVRDDNPGAIKLYEELGWREEARRTTWRVAPGQPVEPASAQVRVSNHAAPDWARQSEWFECIYPQLISWYYPSFWDSFRPGIWNSFQRFLGDLSLREWSAYEAGQLTGALVAQTVPGKGDHLWAAVPLAEGSAPGRAGGDDTLHALLTRARNDLSPRRMLTLDYPAYEGVEAIQRAGFFLHRTLIWMRADAAPLSLNGRGLG